MLEAVVSENVVHEETGRIEARVQLVAASAADAEQWADAFGMTAVANPPPAHLLWTLISAAVGPDDPADLHVWQLVSPEW